MGNDNSNQVIAHVAPAYALALIALLHSCWTSGSKPDVRETASVSTTADDALSTAKAAKSAADEALRKANEAQDRASDSRISRDYDKVKIRNCEEWLGDRQCELVK